MITTLDFGNFDAKEITLEQYNQMVHSIYDDNCVVFKIPLCYIGVRQCVLVGFMSYNIYCIPIFGMYPDELFDSSDSIKIKMDGKDIPVVDLKNFYDAGYFTKIHSYMAYEVNNSYMYGMKRAIEVGGYIWEHLDKKYLKYLLLFNTYQIIMNTDNSIISDKFVAETIGGDKYIDSADEYYDVFSKFINKSELDILNRYAYMEACDNTIINKYRKERISMINKNNAYKSNGFHIDVLPEKLIIKE